MENLFDPNLLGTFALLVGLELVLGIDNILVISIITGRLPRQEQSIARISGLGLALLLRVSMLFGVTWLQKMSSPILASLSVHDLVLLAGGLFLLYKAAKEMHHVVELSSDPANSEKIALTFSSAVTQIVALDAVFSLDSVVTAVGLSENMLVIVGAVVVSFALVLIFAKPIANFVLSNPTLKILALAFLLCIGVTLCMEAFHHEIPKPYLYLPMAFALAVELVQLRYDYNRKRREV
ncbi:MAG: TerC family protein [Deltaproteobacteria bacterium]|nr:TerC family protein [Deltaproteobacteria bacterium]